MGERIAGQPRDVLVDRQVGLHHPGDASFADRLLKQQLPIHKFAHVPRGHSALPLGARGKFGGQGLQGRPDLVQGGYFQNAEPPHKGSPVADHDQPLGLEPPYRFPHRSAAHAELYGQRDLGEPVAGPVSPNDDRTSEHRIGVV